MSKFIPITQRTEYDSAAPMTRREINLRKTLVQLVKSGISGALGRLVSAADALRTLRDDRLYRNTHKTFEEFCQSEFALTRRMINTRIQAAGVFRALSDARNLGTHGFENHPSKLGTKWFPNESGLPLPESERQLRYLIEVPEEKRPQVWVKAVEISEGLQPTAKVIRQVVAETTGKSSKVDPVKRDRLLAKRALSFLRSINKPTKQISAALSILSKEFESDADGSNKTKKGNV